MMANTRHPLVCCEDCQLDDDIPRLEGLNHMDELQDHRHQCLFDYIEPLANGCFRLGQCWRHYSAMCPLGETFFTLDPLPDKETEWEVWKTTMDFPSEPRGYRLVLLTSAYEFWVQSDGVISAHKPGELGRAMEPAQGRRKRARVCGPHEIANQKAADATVVGNAVRLAMRKPCSTYQPSSALSYRCHQRRQRHRYRCTQLASFRSI